MLSPNRGSRRNIVPPPFKYADKISKRVETFCSMQRQTLKMAFENFERSKNLRYESFSRTQVSLQDATETFGQQVLTTQLAVRRFINLVFQPKLLKTARRWETLQHNFSIHCEHVLNQINYVWWCQNGLRSKVKMQKAGHSS